MEGHLSSVECLLVRETMVRQEKMYKEQVQALHYLYGVQKTLMDEHVAAKHTEVQASIQLQDHEFPPPERVKRNFDLEKLPDECWDEDAANVTSLANDVQELDLHFGLKQQTDAGRLPKYNSGDIKANPTGQVRDLLTALNSQDQQHQTHWLSEETRIMEASNKQSCSYLQLGNSWLQLPEGGTSQASTRVETNDFLQRFGNTPLDHVPPWYAQHSTAAATHPWQASGAAYFSGVTYSSPPNGFSNGSTLANFASAQTRPYSFSDMVEQKQKDVYGLYRQQRELSHQQYSSASGFGFGDRNFFGEATFSTTARSDTQTGFSFFSSEPQRSCRKQPGTTETTQTQVWNESDVQLSLLPQRSPKDEFGSDPDKLAASVLCKLKLDTTFCSRKANNPKKSVESSQMDVVEAADDEFEALTVLLKELEFEEHAPVSVEPEQVFASPVRKTFSSGRPKRAGKKQRDFRSETLPSMTSLSRQEITEDFQMMSGLMDSTGCVYQMSRRGSKFCNSSSKTSSPVSPLEMNNINDSSNNTGNKGLPWLVSWGVSTRRKRKHRQRSTPDLVVPHKLKLINSASTGRAKSYRT